MEFTSKKLVELLEISQQNIDKALKKIPSKLEFLDGSSKPVKHYNLEDLPERYQVKLETKGIKLEKIEDTNISKANFTEKYFLATGNKQKKAVLKCRLIEYYLKRKPGKNQQQWIDEIFANSIEFDFLGTVSKKQLNDWLRKYNEAKTKGLNLVEAFIDLRGSNKRNTTALTIEMQEMAQQYFLRKSHITITNIHLLMCSHFGDTMPSYDSLNNYFHEWKQKNIELYTFSKSPDDWKNKYQIALGSESSKAKKRNEYWEFDATPADIMCSDGKRYTILGLIDITSRRVIFRVEDRNDAYAVSRLLREGILTLGIPGTIVIDNGKEFTSNHFESVCRNLQIDLLTAPPFSGEKKPFIERVFGTLARSLFAELDGFIGHNVSMREEIQARKSFGNKIMAQEKHKNRSKEELDAFEKLWMIRKENVGIKFESALSRDELQKMINLWVTKFYEQKKHGGLNGKSPMNVWNSFKKPVDSIGDERMLDLLLGKSVEAKVGKKGIRHKGCTYWHDELLNWEGQRVKLMLQDDMGRVLVYDMNTMNIICEALDLEYLGDSREVATNAQRLQKLAKRKMNEAVRLAEQAKLPTMKTALEKMDIEETAQTRATTKQTPVTNMLLKQSHIIEEHEKKELEESKQFDFKNKDEDGRPTKTLKGGRPKFETFTDRMLWCLENNDWNDKDKKIKDKYPDSYDMALKEFNLKKGA
jgi:transposase InsO family protein